MRDWILYYSSKMHIVNLFTKFMVSCLNIINMLMDCILCTNVYIYFLLFSFLQKQTFEWKTVNKYIFKNNFVRIIAEIANCILYRSEPFLAIFFIKASIKAFQKGFSQKKRITICNLFLSPVSHNLQLGLKLY